MHETDLVKLFAKTDWAVVWATVIGPIAAVAISIWLDRRARARERRLSVVNNLIQGRTISTLSWNQAPLQIPLEFQDNDQVMERWEECNRAAREQRITDELMDSLIKATLMALGYPERHAGQAVRSLYRTTGVSEAEAAQQNALRALPVIAQAATQSASAASEMVSMMKIAAEASRGTS